MKDFWKKRYLLSCIAGAIGIVCVIGTGAFLIRKPDLKPSSLKEGSDSEPVLGIDNDLPEQMSEEAWSPDSLMKGRKTVIDSKIVYNCYIKDIETAEKELRLSGEETRALYDNEPVEEIEKEMEKTYGIYAVNLGEMDIETAKALERAVEYVYNRYPVIEGTLTNIILGNLDTSKSGIIALTRTREFMINGTNAATPFVMKHEIVLSAYSFLKRDELLKTCLEGAENGRWPQGMDISALVVHELGHQVLNAVAMKYYGYEHPYYVTEDTLDAYSSYITDSLASNQEIPKMVCNEAYEKWSVSHPNETYEDFCHSISSYATGIQDDGGISYCETVAEAVTDIYLNGEQASFASMCVEEILFQESE